VNFRCAGAPKVHGYPPMLYDSQRQFRKLALTEPLDLERFTWLSSDSVEELELNAVASSNCGTYFLVEMSFVKKTDT